MTDDAPPPGTGHPYPAQDAADAATLRQDPRRSAPAPDEPPAGALPDPDQPTRLVQTWDQAAADQATTPAPVPADPPPQGYPQYPAQYPAQAYPGDQQYPSDQYQQYPSDQYQQYAGQQYPSQAYPGQQYPQYQQYPGQQYPGQQYPGQQYPQYPQYPGQHDAGQQYQQYQQYAAEQPAARRSALTVVAVVVAGLAVLSVLGVVAVLVLGGHGPFGDNVEPVSSASPGPSTSASPSASPSRTTPPPASSASPAPKPQPSPGTTVVSSVALSKGNCIKTLPKRQTITEVALVACTSPHAAQVGVTFSPAGAAYPGAKQFETIIARECPARLNKVIRPDAPALSWTGYYPELLEWTGGDHSIKCVLLAQNGKPLSRSVIK